MKMVNDSPTKSCSLDCLPTHIFKKYINLFVLFLTSIINLCLRLGKFPALCKHDVVVPLLKKSNLNQNERSNFRPVSNLSFVSKVIERLVARQFWYFLRVNDLMPVCQSGYRQFHSTETALLQILFALFATVDAQIHHYWHP